MIVTEPALAEYVAQDFLLLTSRQDHKVLHLVVEASL